MHPSITHNSLTIDKELYTFITQVALPNSGISTDQFWDGFEQIIKAKADTNQRLLDKRDALQTKLDAWYLAKKGKNFTQQEHKDFLRSIGYLEPDCEDYSITTTNIDPEIAHIAGPQLVVPADNSRYALNACNARWGSLFDALYGTNMISDEPPYQKTQKFNLLRAQRVFAFAFSFLDEIAPFLNGSFAQAEALFTKDGQLLMRLESQEIVTLKDPSVFEGYCGEPDTLTSVLLVHNGLHVEIQLDRAHAIGSKNTLGVKDIHIESALSTIMDCEDSVAAVDASDKIRIYSNWNGLMAGNLETTFVNKGKQIYRTMQSDKTFTSPKATEFTLKGRTLLLIRNVGLHMYTDAITCDGQQIPEGFLDAMVCTLCAIQDLKRTSGIANSTKGSVYIVKPKCHGSEEIAFVSDLFADIERVLALPHNTIKIGIMDEERRTTANLKQAIHAASERVFFINTGFLDRTGDEIHSCMELGAVLPKEQIKKEPWLEGYENQNVAVGLATGFCAHAQIGKGMWTMPEHMLEMYNTKIAHPLSGANTAWVPSPVAATLHALHYHKVDVKAQQATLANKNDSYLDAILTPPMLRETLSQEEIIKELQNNIQSILGYVVRWIDQGVGCSKVPDINNIALMEDRATLRISSQHIANWLHHGITNKAQVRQVFEQMAAIVDTQNATDPHYKNMAPEFDTNIAFAGALDLVFKGTSQANGYTEFILHRRRRKVKNS